MVAWTTTPWTLPTNFAVAVNPDFDYVKVKDLKRNKILIVAECRLCELYKVKKPEGEAPAKKANKKPANKKKGGKNDKKPELVQEKVEETKEDVAEEVEFEILERFKGKTLEGKEYVALFDYYQERRADGCFRVVCADFVESGSGTGLVHCSPAYGEDDYATCVKYKMIPPNDPGVSVDSNGCFLPKVSDFAGLYIKDADKLIMKALKQRDRVIKDGQFYHSYPYCYRSHKPLIYKAESTWFIKVPEVKEDLIKNVNSAHWVPDWAKTNKMNSFLQDVREWCFTRTRCWGNPVPIWVSDDGEEIVCIGSIEELQQLTGATNVTDIHRENVDDLTIPSRQGKGTLRRIPEVFDCWFESGSMPYASFGYPFKMNDEEHAKKFPASFIGEGLDQTRGWFYTLNVISTIIKNQCPFKNLVVNGIVNAEDGTKMSKSKMNFDPPLVVVEAKGADAVRLYLMNSPLVKGEAISFKTKGVNDIVKDVFIPWFHVYRFLLQNINRWELENDKKWMFDESLFNDLDNFSNIFDKWILASTQDLISFVRQELGAYRLYTVVQKKIKFLYDTSNWYLRLNKDNLMGKKDPQSCNQSLNVLFYVLMNSMITMAPYVPFIVESFYQNMAKCLKEDSTWFEESIHFLQIPKPNDNLVNNELIPVIERMQRIIERCRYMREKKNTPIKQPVEELLLVFKDQQTIDSMKVVESFIQNEINVAKVTYTCDWKKYMTYKLMPNHKVLGDKYGADYEPLRKKLMALKEDQINEFMDTGKVTIDDNVYDKNLMTPSAQFMKVKETYKAIDGGIDFAVVLDLTISEALKSKGLKREVVNRIQKLRKDAKLSPTDAVIITYEFHTQDSAVESAVNEYHDDIRATLTKPFLKHCAVTHQFCPCGMKKFEYENTEFTIRIYYEQIVPVLEKIATKVTDEKKLDTVLKTLACYNAKNKSLKEKSELVLNVDGEAITLVKNEDYKILF